MYQVKLYILQLMLCHHKIYIYYLILSNLAKYLNEDFHSYDTLLAENFIKLMNILKQKNLRKVKQN